MSYNLGIVLICFSMRQSPNTFRLSQGIYSVKFSGILLWLKEVGRGEIDECIMTLPHPLPVQVIMHSSHCAQLLHPLESMIYLIDFIKINI